MLARSQGPGSKKNQDKRHIRNNQPGGDLECKHIVIALTESGTVEIERGLITPPVMPDSQRGGVPDRLRA
jgi:hypothetical protein